ncbi:PorP/SprF family type IX secretion system membrane protein [Fulvivirga ligni]|uniref:PorP/SprF family type IX secretion system membrane protein n=1 Tax=Fulvivirga ligni TaxID=2904246 RepID=UPI001F26421A|nr:type IX secretion system membrane protein PorP/SprF [Fulvivirga ligni]UII23799.1 type IX secretion system membrane protein PorP/SprF [Fulvivirga ligni]
MKKLLLPILMIVTYVTGYSQQDPLHAQYLNNPLVLNPAYSGINNVFNATLSHRSQWSGFSGAPETTSFTAHTSLVDNKVGVGLIFVRDGIANITNTEFSATGSYKIDLGDATFSFGLQAGVVGYKESNSELNVKDPDKLFEGDQNFSKFNFGAGVALKAKDYYLGLSIPRMINSTADFGNLEGEIYQRHVYLAAGYVYHLNAELALKPSVLLKGVSNAPLSVDYNASVVIHDKYTAGVFSRNFNTYGLLAQFNFKDHFRLGYVFEVPGNNSVGTSYSTHEITLGVDFEIFDFHFLSERYF